jgi:hypothetical protein
MSARNVALALVLVAAHACSRDDGGDAGQDDEGDEGTFEDPDDAGAASEIDASAGDGGCNQADIEPNGTIATARPLAATRDCDKNGNKIHGTISGAGDVDYFHFHGADTPFCDVNPSATIDIGGVHLCMYAACDSPTGSVSCGAGTLDTAPPAGVAGGCCIDGPATLDMSVNCPGIDDSATMYLRASAIGATVCKTYTITYHY